MKILSARSVDDFVSSLIPKDPKNQRKIVQSIIDDVKKKGDFAVKRYEKKFSRATISSLRLSKKEIKTAYSKVTKEQITAIKLAKKRLCQTEIKLKRQLREFTVNTNGTKILKSFLPIPSVGCYAPGGLARYPSSAIMSVIPAKVAGVKRIVVVSPPDQNGNLDPLTIVSADICGANEIYKTGGAQAIAALAFGTESIPKVDKIVGPGSKFVTSAKILVSEYTSIDMVAGPTELGIIVDNSANPNFISSDLISQAEHSKDSFCFVLTTSSEMAKKIKKSVEQKIKTVKRAKIIRNSLQNKGFIAVCKNQNDLIKLVNKLSPEHLELIIKKPETIISKIITAGLVLVGQYSPSAASDYLLGSNHILPTTKFGKVRGSLSVLDFLKLNTILKTSKSELKKISKHLEALTRAEDLPNHYEAIRIRLE